MVYDVDNEYEFREDQYGRTYLPSGLTMDGNLYVLPNGKYLPPGVYWHVDGSALLYEPRELSPFADMLANCTEP